MWKKRKKKNENIQRQYLVRKNPQMVWMKMRAAANATNLICAHRKHSIGSCVTMEWDMVLAVNQIILLNGTHISFGVYLPFAYVNSINKQLLAPCIFLIGWFSRLLLSCSVDDTLSLYFSFSVSCVLSPLSARIYGNLSFKAVPHAQGSCCVSTTPTIPRTGFPTNN